MKGACVDSKFYTQLNKNGLESFSKKMRQNLGSKEDFSNKIKKQRRRG